MDSFTQALMDSGYYFRYNVRIKIFPDGTRQYMWAEKSRGKNYSIEERKKTGDTVERKEEENEKRAKQVVFDLARSNDWEWFITLTLNKKYCNRYDYEDCCRILQTYTRHLRYEGCRWIIVPEQHKKHTWHFHGLLSGPVKAVRATNAHTGQPLIDKHGREVYNLTDYKAGYTTAVKVDGSPKVATYLTKYYTKDMQIPKGKKRYWASRNLARPSICYEAIDGITFEDLFDKARYRKEIHGPYGDFILIET